MVWSHEFNISATIMRLHTRLVTLNTLALSKVGQHILPTFVMLRCGAVAVCLLIRPELVDDLLHDMLVEGRLRENILGHLVKR